MKKALKTLAIIFLLHFIVSANAIAVPITGTELQTILDQWGLDAQNDQMIGNHNWSLTNASGASNMVLYHEIPIDMEFGIYSIADRQEATVFDAGDTPVAKATVSFDAGDAIVVQYWDAGGILVDITSYSFTGQHFGFWISNGTNKYYSDSNRNDVNGNGISGEEDDIAILVYNADPGSYVFAGDIDGDKHFANIVAQAESILPSPEPASMVLLGIGLLGLAGVTRRKLSPSN